VGGTVRSPVEVVVHVSAADPEGQTALGDGISAESLPEAPSDCGVVPMPGQSGRTIDVRQE
jgi:hypothetical protein